MTDEAAYGARTLELLQRLAEQGAEQMTLLMRHSAREYAPGRHDLENPLTADGRRFAHDFGAGLPPGYYLRAYASPVARCEDTAELAHAAYLEAGGSGKGVRPVEGLGVFYVLDQMKMFKAMTAAADGMHTFVEAWMAGRVAPDIVLPAPLAARHLLALLVARMDDQPRQPGLDLCVSHDLTLYMMREQLLGLTRAERGEVRYLDGMVVFRVGDALHCATHDRDPVAIGHWLDQGDGVDARMG